MNSDNSQTGLGTSVLNGNSAFLTAGVYNNGAGLTSVGGTGRNVILPPSVGSNNTKDNLNPTIGLFGGKTGGTGNYSDGRVGNGSNSAVTDANIVAPSNVQVKLTLVPGTSSNTPSR